MKFDVVTIFPRMVEAALAEGVVGRAIGRGIIDVRVHDLRDFAPDRHRVVDDSPFGGGPGMVMKPEPFFRAVEHIRAERGLPSAVILPTPQGGPSTHAEAVRLSGLDHVVVLFGRGRTLIFIVGSLGMGVLISNLAQSQMQAMYLAMFIGLSPSIILSGMLFPRDNMPAISGLYGALLPVTHYLTITRAIILRGVSAMTLWKTAILPMIVLSIVYFVASVLVFRKRI